MSEPCKKSRAFSRRNAWLGLFALVIQLSLPLAHFCALDRGHPPHGTGQAVTVTAPLPPLDQTSLQKSSPLRPGSAHDHSTCPICSSLQRLGTAELPDTQAWTSPRLTGARLTSFHLVSFSQQQEWSTSSPRGPPRNS